MEPRPDAGGSFSDPGRMVVDNRTHQHPEAAMPFDPTQFPQDRYDAAHEFVFSQPFQTLMTEAHGLARGRNTGGVPAALVALARKSAADPSWKLLGEFIDRVFQITQADRIAVESQSEFALEAINGAASGTGVTRNKEAADAIRDALLRVATSAIRHLNPEPAPAKVRKDRLGFRPGVFDYSGLGEGRYWNRHGETVECTRSQAAELARIEGVPFVQIDRMEGASGYTSNWRDYLVTLPASRPKLKADQDYVLFRMDGSTCPCCTQRITAVAPRSLNASLDAYFVCLGDGFAGEVGVAPNRIGKESLERLRLVARDGEAREITLPSGRVVTVARTGPQISWAPVEDADRIVDQALDAMREHGLDGGEHRDVVTDTQEAQGEEAGPEGDEDGDSPSP